ncbi:MAG: hypothetical protein ACK5OU_19865, partial [Dolichospermum sp.]
CIVVVLYLNQSIFPQKLLFFLMILVFLRTPTDNRKNGNLSKIDQWLTGKRYNSDSCDRKYPHNSQLHQQTFHSVTCHLLYLYS